MPPGSSGRLFLSEPGLGREAVPHSTHRVKMLGQLGIGSNFLPRPCHVHIHGARRDDGLVCPNVLKEFVAEDGLLPVVPQIAKQPQFLACKGNPEAASQDFTLLECLALCILQSGEPPRCRPAR